MKLVFILIQNINSCLYFFLKIIPVFVCETRATSGQKLAIRILTNAAFITTLEQLIIHRHYLLTLRNVVSFVALPSGCPYMDPPAYTRTTSPTAKGVVPACVRNPSSRGPRCPAHTIEHGKTTRPPLAHPTPGRTRTHTYLHPRFRLHPSNAISYTHVRYVSHLIAQETFICLIHAVVDEPGKPIYHLTTSLSQTTFHRCLSNPGIFSLHVYSILQGFTANILIFLIMHVLQDSGILKACLLAAVH